jgi:hypothetical protein
VRRAGPAEDRGMSNHQHKTPAPKHAAKALLGIAAILAGVVVTHFTGLPHPHVDLPSFSFIDLPGWLGPTLRWGRFAVVGLVVCLFVLGMIEDARSGNDDLADDAERTS